MKDKLVGICESGFGFPITIVTENARALDSIEKITLEEESLLGFTPNKVKVDSNHVDCLIEYSNNLERCIKDSNLEFHEAVEQVCKENNILSESVVIVVDESCVDKLDLVALSEKYRVKRK